MTAVRVLWNQVSAAGVTLSIDWEARGISCDPRGQLPTEVEAEVTRNVQGLAVWQAVSEVIDPARLGVLLNWMAKNRPDLYDAEEEAGLRLAESWAAGRRGAFFEALGRWTAILRQGHSEARGERHALEDKKIPIWCWWARYTPRGSEQSTPLSVLFEVEVGLPSDDEADILSDGPGGMTELEAN